MAYCGSVTNIERSVEKKVFSWWCFGNRSHGFQVESAISGTRIGHLSCQRALGQRFPDVLGANSHGKGLFFFSSLLFERHLGKVCMCVYACVKKDYQKVEAPGKCSVEAPEQSGIRRAPKSARLSVAHSGGTWSRILREIRIDIPTSSHNLESTLFPRKPSFLTST